ncbi:2,3-bisphosphoglycerate-independent phosphoglycerate mutase [Haloarcula nitratireducens]|uniref:2,3-bisphosphoglycerate-independent phosphoglycerate mutase n=1 Tax=Haloarcula nitratireducens TaxID=2487749 RepID=A0AAW4PBL3_9EURY|nr:2,3-bisphosphoglycerate-independent phosphoglycerate mutase [Halomicroarcula nitratireducens]MBX0295121.1 2,3-bisphosphoglycerate-independent phosphoglycerate mutase [Halomicroarcula nitratireducens]
MQVGLIILDGWGLNPDDGVRDAVAAAETPNFDRYWEEGAHSTLETHGRRVGLPEGQMGNSEVGHLNIGSGRVVKQDSTRISDSIARSRGELSAEEYGDAQDPPLFENETVLSAFKYAEEHGGRVHFMGLVSDGGVHSYQDHLHALIELAGQRGTDAVTHAFTDGRDTSPTGGEDYLAELEAHANEHGTGNVATVTGRYYAMDRDQNWDRTRRAYNALVDGEGDHYAPDAVSAVTESYARDTTDEFVEPTVVGDYGGMEDGDAAILFNFRADRARQLTRMLADIDPEDWGDDTTPPDIHLVTMTQYDAMFGVPMAFPPNQPEDVLGEVLAEAGKTQLRLAESEKYPHVTYFLNGGREVEFDGEVRRIIESPDVPTYDQQPEMSAPGVTDTAIELIESDDPDALVLNYANPDMVGHTGDFAAAIEAVEAVDEQLGRLVGAIRAAGGHVLICADHGNADDLGTEEDPYTAHTTNPVPFVYLAPDGTAGGKKARDGGTLADLAPTMLALMGVDQPPAMTGTSLVE